ADAVALVERVGRRRRAVAERAHHLRDGGEAVADVRRAPEVAGVPASEQRVERGEAPGRRVVGDREDGSVAREHVEVGRRRRGDGGAALGAAALSGAAEGAGGPVAGRGRGGGRG